MLRYLETMTLFSETSRLQNEVGSLLERAQSSSSKELQLQAELSAAQSEIKQLQGAVSDADIYSKRCQELQAKINGMFWCTGMNKCQKLLLHVENIRKTFLQAGLFLKECTYGTSS